MSVPPPRSLVRFSQFSAFWHLAVLSGLPLLAIAGYEVATSTFSRGGPALLMCAALLVALELLPLVQGRGHDPQGVVMSTAFVCAMLFLWGPWPAIVMVSVAACASDLRAEKPWWKVAFNVGQYATSVFAAYLVMYVAGSRPSIDHPLPRFHVLDLAWVLGVWAVYFLVNLFLVAGIISFDRSFKEVFLEDFSHYTTMTFAVLGISPAIVILAQNLWQLLPSLLIPLLLLYRMAQMSLEHEHDASHDPLTGLPNRASMRFALNRELSFREKRTFGFLLIDLDHFKEVNDTLGHHVGDDLLVHVAQRLSTAVRTEDLVARLGGDEFAVIIPDADERRSRAIAERIRVALSEPIYIQSLSLRAEASIGLAMFPEHGSGEEELLRHADVAMYTAKQSRQGIALYAAERDPHRTDRLGLLSDLRQAIADDVLELHYQPKISLADGSLLGVEGLVRWRHPSRGFVPPDMFIPLAEQSDVMPLLTQRVVSVALAQLAAWNERGLQVPIAVNVSPIDLTGHRLTDLLARGLEDYGIAAGLLQLEITERVVAEETAELQEVLAELNRMGIPLSIDDFGTGYSSLLRLKTLPVGELKIDRTFVSKVCESRVDVGIVRAIIDLAHALDLPAIAEGVETVQQQEVLRSLGCDGVQGWLVARPMPAEQITDWILQRRVTSLDARRGLSRATMGDESVA
ncbi:EAL domain-containing protein [Jatrophihabitans telluris]|uniref:EAL domain-containing protein n=1 Tax=Jatrophihabitans telluris TaxID=2038343 RepID=A0ABY4QWR8_9ACTN|nr:EAL domain-containing protein [Jatrophihabitans telluris]UQX87607.1 EAL domain-containing protein [Jatrophihabitans telluris]